MAAPPRRLRQLRAHLHPCAEQQRLGLTEWLETTKEAPLAPLLDVVDAHHHLPAAEDYTEEGRAAALEGMTEPSGREYSCRVVGEGCERYPLPSPHH